MQEYNGLNIASIEGDLLSDIRSILHNIAIGKILINVVFLIIKLVLIKMLISYYY
jgi:hypothetical protein